MKLREAEELELMMKADEESRLLQQQHIREKEAAQAHKNEQADFLKA